jgi:hypothetical protein
VGHATLRRFVGDPSMTLNLEDQRIFQTVGTHVPNDKAALTRTTGYSITQMRIPQNSHV